MDCNDIFGFKYKIIGLEHQYEYDKFNFRYLFVIRPQALI